MAIITEWLYKIYVLYFRKSNIFFHDFSKMIDFQKTATNLKKRDNYRSDDDIIFCGETQISDELNNFEMLGKEVNLHNKTNATTSLEERNKTQLYFSNYSIEQTYTLIIGL